MKDKKVRFRVITDRRREGDNCHGTNIIFHANKKKIEEMKRLKNKLEEDGKDAQSLHNETSSHGRMVCQSTLSSPSTEILPQTDKSQEVQPSQKPSQLTKESQYKEEENEPTPNKTNKRRSR